MSDTPAAPGSGDPGTPGAGTPPGSGDPGTPGAGTPPADSNWYDGFGENTKSTAVNKGWEGPEAVVEGYANLEKLIGLPADQLLRMPKEDATPEEWGQVWDKLGRPTDANGYELPEGGDENFQTWAKTTFHELGLSKNVAKALAGKYDEFAQAMGTQIQEESAAKVIADDKALHKEWGAAYDQNVGQAKLGAKGLGLDGETLDKIEGALGFAATMKLFYDAGAKMGEGEFIAGDTSSGVGGVLAPTAAMARISALQGDPDFIKRYTGGDITAREEMTKLHEWAYPPE